MDKAQAWFVTERWQELAGEGRAAVVRLSGIALFYAVELLNYYGLSIGPLQLPSVVDAEFHNAATMLTAGWALVSGLVFLHLRLSLFPRALKFITTGLDFLFLTGLLVLADGPRSPLLPLYFLLLGLSALRLSLPLVWFAIGAGFTSYGAVLAYAAALAPSKAVPVYHAILFLAGFGAMGVLCGQLVRRFRSVAEELLARVAEDDA